MSVVILSLSRPILFFCVSVKWNILFLFFLFPGYRSRWRKYAVILEYGCRNKRRCKEGQFHNFVKRKSYSIDKKSLTVCEYFFLDINILSIFLPKKICLTIDKVKITKRDPIFPHSLFIVLLVLPLYLMRCTELLWIYWFHLFFFNVVCLFGFFFSFLFLLTNFFDFLSIHFFFFWLFFRNSI